MPWIPTPPYGRAGWDRLGPRSLVDRSPTDRQRIALVMGKRRMSYGELAGRAEAVAAALVNRLGVAAGDRVAISCRNRIEYFELEIGIAAAGAVMVALSWRYAAAERIKLLARSGARVAFVESEMLPGIEAACDRGELPALNRLLVLDGEGLSEATRYEKLIDESGPVPDHDTDLGAAHEIIYTSGTTGRPKGAVWSNGALVFNAVQQALDYGITATSSTYVGFDLNYIGGRHQFAWSILMQGGTVHLKESGGFDPDAVLRYVSAHRISHILWVPTMLYDVIASGRTDGHDTSHLEMIMCGGSPLPADLLTRATAAFPHTRVVQVYGLTEGGGTVTFVPPERLADKVGSAGRPSLNNRIRIVDEHGRPCAAGQVGQIQLRGPAMTTGYWDDPEATGQLFTDGWLNTGDLGALDEDGFLSLSGRSKELIISGGMNIFPIEIEEVLDRHPSVRAAAVIGLPDERWGEVVCAVVEAEPGWVPDPAELIAHCREHLAGHKKPRVIHVVDELPRTMSGKVRKIELQARYG